MRLVLHFLLFSSVILAVSHIGEAFQDEDVGALFENQNQDLDDFEGFKEHDGDLEVFDEGFDHKFEEHQELEDEVGEEDRDLEFAEELDFEAEGHFEFDEFDGDEHWDETEEFVGDDAEWDENEYEVENLCEIPNLCAEKEDEFEITEEEMSEIMSYTNADGSEIKFLKLNRGEDKHISVRMSQKKDEEEFTIMALEFYDYTRLLTNIVIRTQSEGIYHVTELDIEELTEEDMDIKDSVKEIEDEFPDILGGEGRSNLHQKLARRRLQTNQMWYSIKIVFSQTTAKAAADRDLSLQDLADDVIAETDRKSVV